MNLKERSFANGKYTYKLAMERANRLNAFPPFANTPRERNKILQIYIAAQVKNLTTKRKWHVDHIIPLCGFNVCGLHISSNLRIVSKQANEAKSNYFLPYIERNSKRVRVDGLIPEPKVRWIPPKRGRKNPTKKSVQKLAKKLIFKKRNFYK